MRILLAFDKFKDALSAREACAIVAGALGAAHDNWQFDLCPLTDGGEGLGEILTTAVGGTLRCARVAGPRGELVTARFGLVAFGNIPLPARTMLDLPGVLAEAHIAVVEMAQASGLMLLQRASRDPWQTSTFGTGQLIRTAVEVGARGLLLGVGGSATHDLGLGALAALGLEFRTADGQLMPSLTPSQWPRLARIAGEVHATLPPIRIACDVTNPLLGLQGAAAVYAPQKGLRAEDYARLDQATARVAALLCAHCDQPESLHDTPGSGAAGGIAFGMMCATRARLLPGFGLVSAWLRLEARLAAADVVITGEGRFDESSLCGKGPGAVAQRALELGKPVHVFAGQVAPMPSRSGLYLHGITPSGTTLSDAIRGARSNLAVAALHAFGLCATKRPKPRL